MLKNQFILGLFFCFASVSTVAQECNIFYVTPNGSGSGTKASPTSIQNALNSIVPGTDHIRMAEGTYPLSDTLYLVQGVTVEGGYNPVTWVKNNNSQTLFHRDNTAPTSVSIFGLVAINISDFHLNDLSVLVDDANEPSSSTCGIYLNGCSDYSLSRVKSTSGSGADGLNGNPGSDGNFGVEGGIGEDGNDCGDGNYAAGAGGNSWGVGISVGGNGGDGGPEGADADFWPPWDIDWGEGYDGQPGLDGLGPNLGVGGTGGPGWENATPSPCVFLIGSCTAGAVNFGQNGLDAGPDGADGIDGIDGTPSHLNGFFAPGDGAQGDDGVNGAGGGGGGGGGSHGGALFGDNGSGPGGGGGGEGGQAGTGAFAGAGGGGSFGIYIANNGTGGVLNDCVLNSGNAGIGGVGGFPGGLGGQGGLGGWGGQGCGQGGQGGDGNAGGDGGNGGNGAPGLSQPLYEEPTGIQTVQTSLAANVEPEVDLGVTGCTFSDIYYSTNANGIIEWFYEGSTVPINTVGPSTEAQYTTMGAFDLTMVSNGVPYFLSEFVNIFIDGSPYLPTIVAEDTTCPGDMVNFSSTWPINFNVLGYRWHFGDPASGAANTSSIATPAHTYNEVGTYMVTLQTESPCCGWAKPDTHYVVVMPPVEPEVFITATSTEICEGESITFGAVPYAGGNSPTFEWFQNGVSGGAGPSFTPNFINDGDQVYVRMVSSYPCPLSPLVNSEIITVIVHPNPAVDCSNVTDSYLGAETGFYAQMSVGTPPFEFMWQFGDGGSSIEQSPSHLYGGTGTYNASVEVTDTFGCSAICEVDVEVVLPPYVYAGFIIDTVYLCGSTTVVFTDTTVGNPIAWEWNFGDGANSDLQNPSHSYTGTGPFTVTLTASNGIFSDTLVVPNLIQPLIVPIAGFTSLDTEMCDSSDLRFYDNSNHAATWEWEFGDLSSSSNTSSLQNPYHTFNEPGTYTVSLTVYSVDQCESIAQPINIIVHTTPEPGFTMDTIVCTDIPITINDESFDDIDIAQWSYEFSDRNVTREVNGSIQDTINYTFYEEGWYFVTQHVISPFGCRDSLKQFVEVRSHPIADFYYEPSELQLPDTLVQFWNNSSNAEEDSTQWLFSIDAERGSQPYEYAVNGEWNAEAVFLDSGLYDAQLIVMREIGCPDTLIVPYRVWEQETFFIQTAFTPNGDGVNDVFEIKQKGITEWNMQIYDRWGQLVWETNNVNEFWDGTHGRTGKEVPHGAYSYDIDLVWYRGITFNKLGTITIFR
ncbi:MAG: gliding motility-associated-like protein [Bacteroidia bacterium]|jgi:gliding motility-associated-like protein